uniref:Cytochrome b6-f complex subunit 6 n=1 Tax=Boodleopsis sp. FL1161 TaxID=2364084 RepID=A0A386AZC1_9CHLO|nr:cytochrome b6-f complex subunit 6 [Boodleopsis sp. FL1161]
MTTLILYSVMLGIAISLTIVLFFSFIKIQLI